MAFQKIGGVAGAPNHSGTLSSSSLQQASDNLEKKINLLVLQVFRKPSEEVFEKSSKVQNSGNITLSQLAGKIDTLQKKIDLIVSDIAKSTSKTPYDRPSQSFGPHPTITATDPITRSSNSNSSMETIYRHVYIADQNAKLIAEDRFLNFSKNIQAEIPPLIPGKPYFYIECVLIDPSNREAPQEIILPSWLFEDKGDGTEIEFTYANQPYVCEDKVEKKLINPKTKQEELVSLSEFHKKTKDFHYRLRLNQSCSLRANYDTTTSFKLAFQLLEDTLFQKNPFSRKSVPFKYIEDMPQGCWILNAYSFSPQARMYSPLDNTFHLISQEEKNQLKAWAPSSLTKINEGFHSPLSSLTRGEFAYFRGEGEKNKSREYIIIKIDHLEEKDIKILVEQYFIYVIGNRPAIDDHREVFSKKMTSFSSTEKEDCWIDSLNRFIGLSHRGEGWLQHKFSETSLKVSKTLLKINNKQLLEKAYKQLLLEKACKQQASSPKNPTATSLTDSDDYTIIEEEEEEPITNSRVSKPDPLYTLPNFLQHITQTKYPIDPNSVRVSLKTCNLQVKISNLEPLFSEEKIDINDTYRNIPLLYKNENGSLSVCDPSSLENLNYILHNPAFDTLIKYADNNPHQLRPLNNQEKQNIRAMMKEGVPIWYEKEKNRYARFTEELITFCHDNKKMLPITYKLAYSSHIPDPDLLQLISEEERNAMEKNGDTRPFMFKENDKWQRYTSFIGQQKIIKELYTYPKAYKIAIEPLSSEDIKNINEFSKTSPILTKLPNGDYRVTNRETLLEYIDQNDRRNNLFKYFYHKEKFILNKERKPSEKFPHRVVVISFETTKDSSNSRFKTAEGLKIEEEVNRELMKASEKI